MSKQSIDTGDEVLHRPTGETWLVAFVKGDRLAWCGWPAGTVPLGECRLVRKATRDERANLLQEMARTPGDFRGDYARERLLLRGDERMREPLGVLSDPRGILWDES